MTAEPVEVPPEEVTQAIQRLAREVRLSGSPRETVEKLFQLDTLYGDYLYLLREQKLVPLESGTPLEGALTHDGGGESSRAFSGPDAARQERPVPSPAAGHPQWPLLGAPEGESLRMRGLQPPDVSGGMLRADLPPWLQASHHLRPGKPTVRGEPWWPGAAAMLSLAEPGGTWRRNRTCFCANTRHVRPAREPPSCLASREKPLKARPLSSFLKRPQDMSRLWRRLQPPYGAQQRL